MQHFKAAAVLVLLQWLFGDDVVVYFLHHCSAVIACDTAVFSVVLGIINLVV